MKRFLQVSLGITLICFLAMLQPLEGQVLMLDNFDYPAGDSLTKHNWIQQQTTATFPIMVNSSGLTYAGYIGSGIGNSTTLGVEGQDVYRGFVKQTLPGTVYMAFLAKITAATTAGDFFISLKESPTSPTNANYRGRVWVKADASNNIAFGVTKGAVTAPMVPTYTGFTYSLNTTYLLVMKFTIVAGTVPNDSAQLFINPVIGSPEPIANVICPDVLTGSDLGVGSVLLRQGTNGSSPSAVIDGIRVSKTWQAAITASNVSTLSDLQVDGTTLSGFSPTVFIYNDTVPFGQPTVAVNSTTTCVMASKVTNTTATIPGVSTVVVTAENGTSTSTYSITHAYFFYNVVVTANPAAAGTVSGGGSLPFGQPATVIATPNAGYGFINWTEFGTVVSSSPSYTFDPINNTELVANFGQLYQVTATASPVAGGTITGAGPVVAGGTITLNAAPGNGFIFENWTENGTVIGTNPTLVLTNVTANHDVVGHFTQSSSIFTVSASANPAGAGVITGSGNVPVGGSITLTAEQNWGYVFVDWTENGTVLGTFTSLTLTNVQANHSILANFRPVGVGVDEKPRVDVEIYPTIAKDIVHVKTSSLMDAFQVVDMRGNLILEQQVNDHSATISASMWHNGVYLVRVVTGTKVYTRRIIKE
ncbi:MAG: InlB B-repeat-containing protein [Bacteroidales bacterium]